MIPIWQFILTTFFVNFQNGFSTKTNLAKPKTFNRKNCPILNMGSDIPLVISGFYPTTGNQENYPPDYWSAVEYVVDRALWDIKDKSCILKGYSLIIEGKNTECKAATGIRKLFEVMDHKKSKTPQLALYGGACTAVDEPVAMTTNYFHMVQLSYAETHPKFSTDKDAYSYFYRMVPSYRNVHLAQVDLLKFFNWTKVGIIVQRDDSRYALPQEEVQSALGNKHYIKMAQSVQFTSRKLNIREGLETLKKKDVRIILGFFNSSVAAHVFCQAQQIELVGSLYVWLLFGYNNDSWWLENPSNCTTDDLLSAMDTHFIFEFSPFRNDFDIFNHTGKSIKFYKNELFKPCGNWSSCSNNAFHGFVYDGVWTLALALQRIIVEHKQLYKNSTFNPAKEIIWGDENSLKNWSQRLLSSLNATHFDGLTGFVRFDNNERHGAVRIAQFKQNSYQTVGEFDDKFVLNDSLIRWLGDSIPMSSIRHEIEYRYIDFPVFIIMSIITVLGIAVALCFLIINIHFRRYKFIRMSSPNMNNLIVVGSVLTYLSVVLLGIDTRLVSQETYGYLCTAKLWTLSVGFTLAFGSMFSKTWRVHSIFTNIKLNKKVIKDYKLFVIVFILLLIDFTILIVWLIIDRMQWKLLDLDTVTYEKKNLKVDPKVEYCHSSYTNVFHGLLLSFKGILLIAGVFLAWETRHVNVPALNDSKYIGMSVYNVVVMCSLGVPISFILKDNINAAYILVSIFVIFCTTLTLFLVFIPKVVQLLRNPKDGARKYRQTMMKSAGAKALSNDSDEDRHEELSRIETDNTVWRKCLDDRTREMLDLLRELAKLGDQVSILPSLESTSISRVSHSSIPEDPFGGVYIGQTNSTPGNMETVIGSSDSKSPAVEEATEKTSLLSTSQPYHRPEKRSTSLKSTKIRPSLASVEKSLIIENNMLLNNEALYQSVTSLDDGCNEASQRLSYGNNVNDGLPKDMHYSFISYIDSIRSDDIMSNSRTLPSIKESCLGTSSESINDEADADLSLRSHSSALSIISDEKFVSAVSSLKSSLIYLSIFGGDYEKYEDDEPPDYACATTLSASIGYPRSLTQFTLLTTPSDGTLTPLQNSTTTTGDHSRLQSRDTSGDLLFDDKVQQVAETCELDVCQLVNRTNSIRSNNNKKVENNNGTSYESCDATSSSSSSSSLNERNEAVDQQTEDVSNISHKVSISDQKVDNTKRNLHKKRERFGWLDKITAIKLPISDSADSFAGAPDDTGDGRRSQQVPTNLLQHRGPECPFIVGTKDFEIYAKYLGEKNKTD